MRTDSYTTTLERLRDMTEIQEGAVSIAPIGGLGEFGMNMMTYACGDDLIIIDAGLMFPEADMLGVDLVFPDITYVLENRDKVRGVIITHAHEDHVGGLSFLLRQLNVPVYGTRLTLALARGRLKEYGVLAEARLNVIDTDDTLTLGCFQLEFIHVSHSIPDAIAVVIHTPVGTIVHTSDFKFDLTPVDGRLTDTHKLAALGEKGFDRPDRVGVLHQRRAQRIRQRLPRQVIFGRPQPAGDDDQLRRPRRRRDRRPDRRPIVRHRLVIARRHPQPRELGAEIRAVGVHRLPQHQLVTDG